MMLLLDIKKIKGKGCSRELMLTERNNCVNLFTGSDSTGNYTVMPYDSGVLAFYCSDKSFDDGDWPGERTANVYNITTGDVSGRVVDENGKLIAGVKIYIRGNGSAVTNKKEMFRFDKVTPGEYDIYTLFKNGTEYKFRTVKIESGKGLLIKLVKQSKTVQSCLLS